MCVCVWSGLCPTSDCPTWDSPDPTEPARVPLARALSRGRARREHDVVGDVEDHEGVNHLEDTPGVAREALEVREEHGEERIVLHVLG